MAALQHGLGSTIATKSKLRTVDYDEMRRMIAKEIGLGQGAKFVMMSDADLLAEFHSCG